MDTLDYNTSLTTVIIVLVALAAVVLLYRFFYRDRATDGTDQRNWVNDTNYNVATSDSEAEAIAQASPSEAQHIVDVNKEEGPYPPSEQEFETLNEKVDGRDHDTESVKRDLRQP